jgi:hypothetical protein
VISCAGAVHDGTHLAEDQSLRTSTSSSAERPSSWRTRVCTRVCIDRTKRTLVEFGNYLSFARVMGPPVGRWVGTTCLAQEA